VPALLAVAQADPPGGAEIGLARLLTRLRARGWEITTTTPSTLPLGGLARGTGTAAVLSWPTARRLARRADVVYLNGGVAARLLPALRGRRTVLHVHDMVDRVPWFWRAATVVLADSQAIADRLPFPAHVVGCPIESDTPEVDAPWTDDGRPIVGYVGRIERRKGILDLVEAAPRLNEAGARVVLVGDDPYNSDPGYLKRVREAADVEQYGWIDDAAGLMGAIDVLVLPSHAEPFGTVLAEAMNAGTPVVATRVGGLPEVVDDGVTGRLVEPGDPAALAQAVLEVLSRRDEMGAAARERARRWHVDAYADRVEELIRPPAEAGP
jgi:glycosyltransferase involved in cell wall biosynthesis